MGDKPKVFISRAGEDSERAKWVAEVLQAAGCETKLQDFDIRPGHNFLHKMSEALSWADHVMALLSPAYVAKEFTLSELYSTFCRDGLGEKRGLIPVRIAPCEIPAVIRPIVYVDLVGKDQETARRLLIDAVRADEERERTVAGYRTAIGKLPAVEPTLLGRERELAFLDGAWGDAGANFAQVIAAGGTGKTALVDRWFRRHLGEATIFGWSFYSQGTGENRQAASDQFFGEALGFFGIRVDATASVWARAEALAERLRGERVLLILDGCEPLQDAGGDMKDPALKVLLQELATQNLGLVVCTTRVRIRDLGDEAPRARSLDLDNLEPEHGAEYLRHFGVAGTEEELREASEDYGNHALALTLLGSYLADFCQGDVRKRVEIPRLLVEEVRAGGHARRVMEGYARMFAGKAELEVLRALGYFDRPAEEAALQLVAPGWGDLKYRAAVKRLREARLILKGKEGEALDCHPLVREHFAGVMRETAAEEFRAGHGRLYEYYCRQAPERPDTEEEMRPLFWAVYHGCQAGRHQEVAAGVYYGRILRGNEAYLVHQLGAHGTNLSLLGNFFERRWTGPVASLSAAYQAWVTNEAAFALRALGRLGDAADPMRAGAERRVKLEDWKNAARAYGNLSELQLTLGNVKEAMAAARSAVELADQSGDGFERMGIRTTLADALHQSGDVAEAARLFEEAERIQAEDQPEYPSLYSRAGYQYCDLLLSQGQTGEVMRRAEYALGIAERILRSPLDIGLDHLSLGRAGSATHLDLAVDYLHRAGQMVYLPLALLARGTSHDLEEVLAAATRCGMRLHLADYHLAMARRHQSREHLREAERLIGETGYHRRDGEVEELRREIDGRTGG